MQNISTQTLKQWKDEGRQFALINVLDEEQHRQAHIPGSSNVPVGDSDFIERVQAQVPIQAEPIVVYCASEECNASPKAAKKLEESGYQEVYDYSGGLKDWQDAGFPVRQAVSS